MFSFLKHNSSQKWVDMYSFLRRVVSQKWEHVDLFLRRAWISNIKTSVFPILFVLGQFWVHDVLKSKLFWLIYKNIVLSVYYLEFISTWIKYLAMSFDFRKCQYLFYYIHTIYMYALVLLIVIMTKKSDTSNFIICLLMSSRILQ